MLALDSAITAGTRTSYASAWKKWAHWCLSAGVHPSDSSEEAFCAYLGFLLTRRPKPYAYSSIKSFFSAIRAVHLDSGLKEPFTDAPTLGRALHGAKKLLGTKTKKKLPITVALLRRLRPYDCSTELGTKCWCICVVCLFGLFRMGELTATPANHGQVPVVGDVTKPTDAFRVITLQRSKTDPFRHTVDVILADHGCPDFNAVALLDEVIGHRPSTEPLFEYNGRPITRTAVIAHLKSAITRLGLNASAYSGHSFRRGGAQTLEDLDVHPDIIRELGRWASYCWVQYRTMPLHRHAAIAAKMASH